MTRYPGFKIQFSSILIFLMTLMAPLTVLAGGANGLHGQTGENLCKEKKVQAVGNYFDCLSRAYALDQIRLFGSKSLDEGIQHCDQLFDKAFQHAEAFGECRTVGGSATLIGPIKAQFAGLAGVIAAGAGCSSLTITPGKTAVCKLSSGTSAVDIAAIISQIQAQGQTVDDNTIFWIEAWGGSGAPGYSSESGGSSAGGYAQTTDTLTGYLAFFGTTDLYYYLGKNGTNSNNSGGDGGTATVISSMDLTGNPPPVSPLTVLIAGGGGGGGDGNPSDTACGPFPDNKPVYGGGGGPGGVAIADSTDPKFGAGQRGGERRNVNYSGYGGGGDFAGTGGANTGGSSAPGSSGLAPMGGPGGGNGSPQIGFINQSTSITSSGGKGGSPGDSAPGGAGGGGWGGGGGGVEGTSSSDCVSGGGGGGGSFATGFQGLKIACPAAPTQMPANPQGSQGYAQITFDLGACQ
jgi:hypothetical protein